MDTALTTLFVFFLAPLALALAAARWGRDSRPTLDATANWW